MSSQLYINKTPFLGRVEEQKQFRAVLREVMALQSDEGLPYVLLLYGDGGMGKTSLARAFDHIVKQEEPFAGSFQTLWVDWEEERNRSVSLQVGRDNIAPETVLDLLHAAAARIDLGRHFDGYQKARKLRAEAEKKAAEALNPTGERDDWSEFRSLSASALAKVLRQVQPAVGETGEKLTKAALDAGLKYSADKVAAVENRLRARLNPELFHAFLHPTEQLARALAEGLKRATESGYVFAGKPLIITLDTYEIVDRTDLWLRMVMKTAGPRVLWIVCGRDDLTRSRQFGAEYFKGYTADWPHRLWNWDMSQLAHDDVGKYFKLTVPERPLNEQEHETISRATRGIPLALSEAAELWQRGATLDQIASDIDDTTPAAGIVRAMTARYLLHAMKNDVDRRALYALSLARGDRELLRSLLRPEGDGGFDLNARLQQLERDYASVHFSEARLHDEPAVFFREDLKAMRDEDWVRQLNERAIAHLRARLQKLEPDLPRIEDRCGDEDWVELALRLTDHLFFVDEDEAWRWFVPRFVEGMGYSYELRKGLAGIADAWQKALSSRGKKRMKLFREAVSDWADMDKALALLGEIETLAKRGYLKAEGENERQAILAWRHARLFNRADKHTDTLSMCEKAFQLLPPDCESFRESLASAFGDCGWALGVKRGYVIHSPEAESGLLRATSLCPEKGDYWRRLGVVQRGLNKFAEAVDSISRAIELGENNSPTYNSLGHVYRYLGRHEDAIAAYQQAIALDPKDAFPHNGLGNVYRDLGRHEDAITAYQQAITLDPKDEALHNRLGNILRILGRYEEAVAAYQQAADLDPKDAVASFALAACYRKLGQTEAFETHINLARDLIGEANDYNRACFEAICGNTDEALRLLKTAREKDKVNLAWARRDPDFDWIRDDPRFAALLDEMAKED